MGECDGVGAVHREVAVRETVNRGAPRSDGVVGFGSLGELELAMRVFANNKLKKEGLGRPARGCSTRPAVRGAGVSPALSFWGRIARSGVRL